MHSRHAFAFVVLSALAAVDGAAQTIQINRENKTIAISTTDEATSPADIAAVTVGFEIYGSDSKSTYAEGGKISNAILDALHKAGVADKDIESAGQGVQHTEFDEKATPSERAQKQWTCSQSWTVTSTPNEAAEVIRVAVAAGANRSGAIDWRLSDRKALQAKAAGAALVKAREVATQMAEGLHVRLGELMYASNQTPTTRVFLNASSQAMLNTDMASVSSYITIPKLAIRPQTVREEATVYAVFAIE
jgi:uncharacterized protein YggE